LNECSTSGRTMMPRPSCHPVDGPAGGPDRRHAIERQEDLDRVMRMRRHLAARLSSDEEAALP
jgi:hypothetical protein